MLRGALELGKRRIEPLQQVIFGNNWCIASRFTGVSACGQTLDYGIARGMKEKRCRVSIDSADIDHPMHVRAKTIIGPPLQNVAKVHHKRIRHRRRGDPTAIFELNLQPGVCILSENSQQTVVGMRAGADLGSTPLKRRWSA